MRAFVRITLVLALHGGCTAVGPEAWDRSQMVVAGSSRLQGPATWAETVGKALGASIMRRKSP